MLKQAHQKELIPCKLSSIILEHSWSLDGSDFQPNIGAVCQRKYSASKPKIEIYEGENFSQTVLPVTGSRWSTINPEAQTQKKRICCCVTRGNYEQPGH